MIHTVSSNFDCDNTTARYYFFHIPKTAGTSLNRILESAFSPDAICPPHLWHDLISYDKNRLSSFRLFRGHFYASLDRVVDGPLRIFVFIRNPIERALSHYGHAVRDPAHYLHRRAIELGTFGKYLCDPVARETVRNFQAKSLVCHFDPVEMAAGLSDTQLAEFELEKLIETTPIDLSDAELLERAKRALDKFCCVGITERFEDSIQVLSSTFGWNLKKPIEVLNTNTERPRVSKVAKEELILLEELNAVDIQLYEYAVSLFDLQFQKTQDSISNTSRTFVSHAQNLEDVMLWRVLKHVEQGFYIDVGAWSPDLDTVTKAFYERGWHGLNIEPNPEFNRQLQNGRPRDVNLQVAISDHEGVLMMNFLGNPGLSTLDDAIAAQHQQAGWEVERQEVTVSTLSSIWQLHVPVGQEVHFLKVDVEGFEAAVLKGNHWAKNRPWVVVVEATLPMTQVESHETWEPILIAADYHFSYADGLNRFYIADEHLELLPAFKYPPNVFDKFSLSRQLEVEARAIQAEARATQAEAHATQAEARATQAEARATQTEAHATQTEAHATQVEAHATQAEARATRAEARATQAEIHIAELLNSTSWRMTAPLRWVASAIRRVTPSALKPIVRILLQHAALYVGRRPRLKWLVLAILTPFPGLKSRLTQVVSATTATLSNQRQTVPTDIAHLTPHARQIYANLKAAMECCHKKEG